MHNSYRLFGLNIVSAFPLPAQPVRHFQPDVVIEFGEAPDALAHPWTKGVRYQAAPGEFLLRVDNVARYYLQNGRRITIMPEAGANEEDILIFLMGSVMGALLYQRNMLVLHASAIVANGVSIVFSGPSGVGKSTLAAGFHQRGYPFLADDVCAVIPDNGYPAVIQGFPWLKLWADCLKELSTDKAELKSIRSRKNLEKFFVPAENIQEFPVPIKSIFFLATTNIDSMEVVELKGAHKIDPIIDNTYRLRFLEGLGGKESHFQQCATVAAKAAVYRAIRPQKGFLLDGLMDIVEKRFLS